MSRTAAQCDVIIHAGGVSGPGFVFDPPIDSFDVATTNITGTLNALEAARTHLVRRVVFLSSVIAYWPAVRGETLDETTTMLPGARETYGASKVACEQLCTAYAHSHGLETIALRISWVYGPGRTTGCPIHDALFGRAARLPEDHCT